MVAMQNDRNPAERAKHRGMIIRLLDRAEQLKKELNTEVLQLAHQREQSRRSSSGEARLPTMVGDVLAALPPSAIEGLARLNPGPAQLQGIASQLITASLLSLIHI